MSSGAHAVRAEREARRPVRRRSRPLIRRRPGTRFAPWGIVVAVLAVALVFGVLLERVVLAQSAFKIARLRRSLTAAEAANQDLMLRATALASPRRLERLARERLGMVEPRQVRYVVADVRIAPRSGEVPRPSGPLAVRGLAGAAPLAP